MPKIVSALATRTHLGQIMRGAKEKRTRFVVDKRGEPRVVIMSVEDFISAVAPAPEVIQRIRAQSKRKGTDAHTMREIDAEVADYRKGKRNDRDVRS